MAVTLLRHTTPEVAKGTCYGVTDLDLAASFATEAATALADMTAPSLIISSPLKRCLHLADHASQHFGCELWVAEDWKEMDFGRWEGRLWDDLPRAELDAWAAAFASYRGHGGESVSQLEARITRALSEAPDDALIVTHMGCIKAALVAAGDAQGWQAQLGFGQRVVVDVAQ